MWRVLTGTIALSLLGCGGTDPLQPDPLLDAGPDQAPALLPDQARPDGAPADLGIPDAERPADATPSDLAVPDQAVPNRPPTLRLPEDVVLDEEVPAALPISADDPDGDPVRLWALDLPPGARWHPDDQRLTFTPDFTQGGGRWAVRVVADDGQHRVEGQFAIEVRDLIRPPDPEITAEERGDGFTRLRLRQRTDAFLDAPGHAGRTFVAFVTVPDDRDPAAPKPVRVRFHGLGASPGQSGWRGEFRVATHDPANTYWWGYASALPGGPAAEPSPAYTQRRVLHLLDWVLRTYPGADPDNVYATGGSMGGAGAALFGLRHARHVSYVEATIGQTIARNHRPSRVRQLEGLWGPRGPGGAWDAQDLTALLRDDPLARQQFLFLKHGKDDPTIHFGAVTFASPETGLSFYDALQAYGVGHLAVWDEGGHGSADPALGDGWWTRGWNPVFDDTAWLRRRTAFPAFHNSAANDPHGDGQGNGARPFDPERGYAGRVDRVGDTGWAGARAGCLNRALRWDANRLVDDLDRLEVPLRVLDDGADGDPPIGDRVATPAPFPVDVTLRRVQRFQTRPGEAVAWRFGAASGEVTAGPDGAVTVRGLALDTAWQTLVLTRR